MTLTLRVMYALLALRYISEILLTFLIKYVCIELILSYYEAIRTFIT